MQGDVLKSVDPILHSKLAAEGVEGQLWGMYVDCPLAVVCVSDDAKRKLTQISWFLKAGISDYCSLGKCLLDQHSEYGTVCLQWIRWTK